MNFATKELKLIESKDILALSTVSLNGWPHSVPVSYLYTRGEFYVPANRQSKKVKNLNRDGRVTALVDDEKTESGI